MNITENKLVCIGVDTEYICHVSRARSLAVSDLRLETKDSRFESGCYLCAEVSSLQQSPGQCLSAREAGGSCSMELRNALPVPL